VAFRINAAAGPPSLGLEPGTLMVNDTADRLKLLNVEGQPTVNLATMQPAAIVAAEHQELLESCGLTTWDPLGRLILYLAAAVRRHAAALMDLVVARDMLRSLEAAFPFLGEAAALHAPAPMLVAAMRDLLLDQHSVRDMRLIVERIVRHATLPEEAAGVDLAAFVRRGLAAQLAFKLARQTDTLVVYIIDAELERDVHEASLAADGDWLSSPAASEFTDLLETELGHVPPTAQRPLLLTSDVSRTAIRAAIRPEFPDLFVIGYGDIPAGYNIQPVARIER
jgi:type III secretion protein V